MTTAPALPSMIPMIPAIKEKRASSAKKALSRAATAASPYRLRFMHDLAPKSGGGRTGFTPQIGSRSVEERDAIKDRFDQPLLTIFEE
jgi:hypothetical protein